MDIFIILVATLGFSYLLGSVPFGLAVAKVVKGIDIRNHGSRNIGATNVGRVCGRGWGVLVFALDLLKGAVPVACWAYSRVFIGFADPYHEVAPVFAGLGAILGHIFPAYLQFRGGRGVATAAGVFLMLTPIPAVIALAVWVLLVGAFRYVSLASVTAALALLVAQPIVDPDAFGKRLWVTIFAGTMALLVVLRHIPNIKRLIAGTESRIGGKRDAGPPPDASSDNPPEKPSENPAVAPSDAPPPLPPSNPSPEPPKTS